MDGNNRDNSFGNDIINSLFPAPGRRKELGLKELFDRRVEELQISPTSVISILNTNYRTLNGILNGTQKLVDFTNLIKIASFLQLPREHVVLLYFKELEKNFPTDTPSSAEKVEFIKENFDLAVLKKAGFIDSITDFTTIEKKIVSYLSLKSIFDYKRPPVDVAFSAGLIKPKNELTRSFWIEGAKTLFEEIDNPNKYDRQALINYFPQIRWYTTNVDLGLINVIKDLYRIGVTVAYKSSLPSLHLRGATFNVNGKPCVVLTNYRGFYPTLWFALIHELYHVLFDWDEILDNKYHLSDDDNGQLSVLAKEQEADSFAREYLFSKEKTKLVSPFLRSPEYVEEFAKENHVHPSFVYLFNAYDAGSKDRSAWARANRNNPPIDKLLEPLANEWDNSIPITEFVKQLKSNLYN